MTQSTGTVTGEQGSSLEDGRAPTTDSSLFVVWSNGRHVENYILSDLADRFEVLELYEIVWTPSRVPQNFRRFYADIAVRGVHHALGKGRGPFLAAIVRDHRPRVMPCMTSRGRRVVNARFLDAKTDYRRWAGRLTVHCTETAFETQRDVTMLLGAEADRPRRLAGGPGPVRITRLERDPPGAGGWTSESELFAVLNRAVAYVVTGAAGVRAHDPVLHARHVNLLTDDYLALHGVLDARPRHPWPHGGAYRIRIADRWVSVRVRFVGDRFYDPGWAKHLLASRRMDQDGRYRLPDRDDFEALVHDLFVHQKRRSTQDLQRLSALALELGITDWPSDPSAPPRLVKPWVDRWLTERGFTSPEPLDLSVGYDASFAAAGEAATRRGDTAAARRMAWWRHRARQAVRSCCWLARDQLLIRAPWLRRVKRRVKGQDSRSALGDLRGHPRLFLLKRAALLARGVLFLGRTYRCPCCGWSLRGFVGEWGLLASAPDGYCPRCNAKARHRRLWLYLQEHTNLADARARLLEIAPWWAISRRLLRAPNISFVGLDLMRRGPHVTVVGDATRIPIGNESLEAALCIHTLEHIEDDRQAMRELFRVLKPGGWAIVSVPLELDGLTYEDPTVTDPEDRLRAFGERSHVRLYGLDLEDRLREVGFAVRLDWASEIPLETRRRFGLRDDENLFLCRKSGI